ncbi:hypothetical protein FACS189425_04870 [Clostridia bacterium]|nr:hypothetical protein FACS189425_04870 [Clostridia bacterium]
MNKTTKFKALSTGKADANADIGLINRYTIRELKPEDVYCFSVVLCDNEVDRDNERFPRKSLDKLAQLFVGKTGIFDHEWSASGQVARLYHAEVEETSEKNSLGEPYAVLRGCAYMLRSDGTAPIVDAIDGGILKELSIGFRTQSLNCSICGNPLNGWLSKCENGHLKGEFYDGKPCIGEMTEPTEAYEFSFVAVPAQRRAGVTKELSGAQSEERLARAKILAENIKYLGGTNT